MRNLKDALLYGFLVWLVPFLVAFAMFGVRQANRPLFESVMSVTLVAATTLFSTIFFKKAKNATLNDGISLGALWTAVSLAIDLTMFLPPSPWQMGLQPYLEDIGVTYLVIPLITTGIAVAAKISRKP